MITKPKVEIKGRIANVRIPESIMDEYTVKRICEEHDLLTSNLAKIHINVVDARGYSMIYVEVDPDYISKLKF